MMRVLGYILLTVVCLVLCVGTFLYVAAPVEIVRDQLVAAVKRETGRDLVIRGGTSLAVFPNLGLSLGDVELSAPPEMDGAPFLKMTSLKLAMPVAALLKRQVSVDEFVLEGPEINLWTDAAGRKSWAFDRPGGPSVPAAGEGSDLSPEIKEFIENSNKSAGGADGGATPGEGLGLAGVRLGDVRIVDGTLRYSDARSGTRETVSNVNLTVGLEALTAPLTLDGAATWKGKEVPVQATLTSLDDVLADRPAKLKLAVQPRGLNLLFDGSVDARGEGSATGKVEIATQDLPSITQWLTGSPSGAGPLRNVSFAGQLAANPKRIRLIKSQFTLNDLKGSGDLIFGISGRKSIAGTLKLGEIRTASFLGGTAGGSSTRVSGDAPAASSNQWSTAPIDLSALREIDAKLRIAFTSLIHEKIKIDQSAVAVGLKRGVLQIKANPVAAYRGTVRGSVVLDAQRAATRYLVKVATQRISALPLLKAAADFDWLSGAVESQIEIRGVGRSQSELMRTMAGVASLKFLDGAIEGLDVAKVARGVKNGQFNNFDRVPGEKTDFTSLTASFSINQGVATNSDLRLAGPFLRVAGAGQIDIGRRSLDYGVRPKLIASAQGQGANDVSGLEIPLKINGPWSNPKVAPDLEGLLKDPASALKNVGGLVEKARKNIKSKKVNDLLDGVLGGSGSTDKKKPLGGLLGDFLSQ